MTVPQFTKYPSHQTSPETFTTDADTMVSEFPAVISAFNDAITALNLNDTTSTSSTSLAIGSGSKSLTVDTSKSYQPGMTVKIAYTSDADNWMCGDVTSYNSGTGALVVEVSHVHGSGTQTAWTVTLSGPPQTQQLYRSARTSNIILAEADRNYLIDVTSGTFTQTYTAAATLGDGWFCFYRNSGTGTVTHNPDGSEQIAGATTKAMYPGDTWLISCDGTAFYVMQLVNNTNSEVTVHTGNGHGSTNTKIRRFTTALTNTGTAITYADSAANGASFTINEPGLYEVYYQDLLGASQAVGISLNSTELTTSILTIAIADKKALTWSNNGAYQPATRILRLAATDVIRAHTDGNVSDTTDKVFFSIKKIGL